MRRHARRMRRYGLQPMVVINSDSQLPDLVIILLGRWLWRYRSELAPLALAATMVATALALHTTHPHSWPLILITTLMASCALFALGGRLGLIRLSERMYAATVTTGAGGWLSAATALDPMAPPLLRVLLLGGVVLAVPWWAHRRRRARVRVERKLSAWPEIAQAVGLAGTRVMSAVVDVWGWRARFGLARGQTIQDVINKLPAIESAVGCVVRRTCRRDRRPRSDGSERHEHSIKIGKLRRITDQHLADFIASLEDEDLPQT